ncbi:MAG: tetratricopeptide repeat protein [Acetobacteraceae bacterium]|nr:tetratricopeptide repeat protein [Acetobacteraceae bacterium]
MLLDRYGLAISTGSTVARDAYVEGCDRLLTMYPGALAEFDRAIAADPDFALAHVGRAQTLLLHSDIAAARTARAIAVSLAVNLPAREASHIAFFETLAAGDGAASIAALRGHLADWPRDAMVLTPTAFTNGLIGSSGHREQKRHLLALLDRLAPHYGDDWWFAAHHAMAQSENGLHAAAEAKIEQSLRLRPHNGWGAHTRGHVAYETGDPAAARHYLAGWLIDYPRDGLLYSHLTWHLALAELEAGAADEAMRLYHDGFSLGVHSGAARAKITDAVSFLWRWELAGQPRNDDAWRIIHDFANQAVPHPAIGFSDLHVTLAQAAMGDDAGREIWTREIDDLARDGRYNSGDLVPVLARGFAAFQQRNFSVAIETLAPVIDAGERIGGSRAQLDLIEFTLLKAYLHAERLDDARRLIAARRAGPDGIPVAGPATALHHFRVR